MGRYILRRLLQMIPILFGVSILIFIIVHSVPGNPYSYLFGPRVDPTLKERMMVEMGFRDPLPIQYLRWLKTTASGNLGVNLRTGQPVSELIGKAIPNTLWLTITSFTVALFLAIPIGVVSATRQYSLLDYGVTTFAFMGISLPSFFAGLLMIYFFAVKLRWFPMNGILSPGAAFTWPDYLYHLSLPAITLALRDIAGYSRFTRSSMLEVMRQDYVRTARSKGLAERVVIYKHALRNGLIPVLTLLGFSLPALFGGAIIIEGVFTWRGMGSMTIEAVNNREYGMLMAVNMFFAILVITGNLMADVLYAIADPRIRYS